MRTQVISGTALDVGRLAHTMAEAFRDYVVPFGITRSGLDFILRQRGFEPGLSVALVRDDEVVAFWLIGVKRRQKLDSAYTISTGVLPQFRRRGFAKAAFEAAVMRIAAQGYARIILEVIQNNLPALRLYEGLGFRRNRALISYRGPFPRQKPESSGVDLKTVHLADIIPEIRDLWDWSPSWQHDIESLSNVENCTSIIGAYAGRELCGYGALISAGDALAQLFVRPTYRRRKIATSILHAFGWGGDSKLIRVLNIDAADRASCSLFNNLGWKNYIDQYEMIYECAE